MLCHCDMACRPQISRGAGRRTLRALPRQHMFLFHPTCPSDLAFTYIATRATPCALRKRRGDFDSGVRPTGKSPIAPLHRLSPQRAWLCRQLPRPSPPVILSAPVLRTYLTPANRPCLGPLDPPPPGTFVHRLATMAGVAILPPSVKRCYVTGRHRFITARSAGAAVAGQAAAQRAGSARARRCAEGFRKRRPAMAARPGVEG